MKIQSVNNTTFQGNNPKRAARNIGQVMERLYQTAYVEPSEASDIIQISTKMKNGVEVSGIASFDNGKFVNLRFPYEQAKYRSEFCAKIIQKFNEVMTKGKSLH
jgi:hypothetical protein